MNLFHYIDLFAEDAIVLNASVFPSKVIPVKAGTK